MNILQMICDIIQNYMGLTSGQVWIKNQKIMLPNDQTFSISVGFISLKPIGTSCKQISTNDGMSEEIGTNMYGQVAIDILGKTTDVIERKEEIIQAINSTICKEVQLANGFMISSSPLAISDISGIDGAAIPYRFQYIFSVQFFKKKTKIGLEYYDDFRKEELHEST